MNSQNMFDTIRAVPVVVIKDIEDTVPTLQALCDGGLPAAEITFRTACAAEAIRLGAEKFPQMHIGAGTVVNAAQAKQAIEAGASFIVSPGLSPAVAEICREADVPYLPGCVTPTEIMQALELGITTVKFFPANVYGGLSALKALSGPFPQVKFLPTGGIDLSNINEYLAFDKIVAVGGSFMMKGNIKENCEKLMEVIKA
ncbi:MAG: bifunctional 4-hydroxy-2-oxoglutarate aldolase/2-dehydro-3-deoxy-phosphogluconate aldolase [Ruminococcaceae bacterium]|nr:bifunctional 4-hydroxy-2-oxoglutarate aldolase/2-dehydro-3-deoxy-phosphogluconate aldolase [Oscillospiraceae bacterium]